MQPKFHDTQYLNLIETVLDRGIQKGDRTGTGTISTFAQQMRFDLSGGSLPLLTTKKMHTKSIIHELLWFLNGDTNIKYLTDNGVRIWDEWADENGDLGPIYGKQWRDWGGHTTGHYSEDDDGYEPGVDQIASVIDKLRNNPNDRRIVVSAWNVGEIDDMALPPCHAFFQFWSRELSLKERMAIEGSGHFDITHTILDSRAVPRRALSCHLYQRSCDVGLGVPFNIAQYSILVHMIAQVTGHIADEFVWTGGDVHIYNNHVDQLTAQLSRTPYVSPVLLLNSRITEINDFAFDDFKVIDYVSHDTIKMKVSK